MHAYMYISKSLIDSTAPERQLGILKGSFGEHDRDPSVPENTHNYRTVHYGLSTEVWDF
jgi:hypothetical protein